MFLKECRFEDIPFCRIAIINYDVSYLCVAHLSVHIPPPVSLQDGVIENEQEVEVVGDEGTQVLSQEPAEFDLDEWFRCPFVYKLCSATESGQAPRFGAQCKVYCRSRKQLVSHMRHIHGWRNLIPFSVCYKRLFVLQQLVCFEVSSYSAYDDVHRKEEMHFGRLFLQLASG